LATLDGSSPQINPLSVIVVPAELVDLSITRMAWAMPPALFREVAE